MLILGLVVLFGAGIVVGFVLAVLLSERAVSLPW